MVLDAMQFCDITSDRSEADVRSSRSEFCYTRNRTGSESLDLQFSCSSDIHIQRIHVRIKRVKAAMRTRALMSFSTQRRERV